MGSDVQIAQARAGNNEVFDQACPARTILARVTNRWGTLILVCLREGPLRFHVLRDRIGGVSDKMLAQNLRVFSSYGLVHREVEPSVPPRVSYALTRRGRDLADLLDQLVDWVVTHSGEIVTDAERASS